MEHFLTLANEYFTLAAKEETKSQAEVKVTEIMNYVFTCTNPEVNQKGAVVFLNAKEGNPRAWLQLLNMARRLSLSSCFQFYYILKDLSPFKDKTLLFLDSGAATLHQACPDLIPLLQTKWFKKSGQTVEEYLKDVPGVIVINKPTIKDVDNL